MGDQLTYAVVILGLVVLIAGGDLTIGYFVALLGASERFRDAVGQLFFYTTGLNEHLHYLRDLFGYLDIEDERTPPDTTARPDRPMPTIAGPRSPLIELDDVTFSYPGSSTQTLARVSLVVRPKERIALVGENGAGKTTLAKLVLGLYSPSGGRSRREAAILLRYGTGTGIRRTGTGPVDRPVAEASDCSRLLP